MAKNPLTYCIFGIIALAAFLSPPIAAASVDGFVFGDADGDGSYDPATDPLLPDWDITLAHTGNGTVIATVLTNGTGWYSIAGLDARGTYRVTAGARDGWTPTTPSPVETGCHCIYPEPLTFHVTNDIDYITLFPDDGAAFTTQSHIGSTVYSTVHELDITTPGLVVRDQKHYTWENGRVYGFNVTYTGLSGTDTVYYTILNGTSATTLVYGPGTLRRPISTIAIRTRGANISGTSRMDVWNLTFTPAGGIPYALPGSANPGDPDTSWADQSAGRGIDVLFVRISTLTGDYGLAERGFTLTGQQRMSWTGTLPTGSNLAASVKFGSTPCPVGERAVVSFGNRQEQGSISGTVTETASGESLPGWTLTLTSQNGGFTTTAVTDGKGSYAMDDLPWDTYLLAMTMPPGYTAATPVSGTVPVTINGTNLAVMQDFTSSRQTGSISGTVSETPGGDPLPGWTLTLTSQTGGFTTTAITDGNGSYAMDDLPWDTCLLVETIPPGYTAATPATGAVLITINGTNLAVTQDFTNSRQPGSISGTAYNDHNGDGSRGVNDEPLSGWTLTLRNQDGTLHGTASTGADGSFRFDDLPWGTYIVSETLKSGWKQTAPAGKNYTAAISPAALSVIGRDFGNQPVPACCSCPVKAYFSAKQLSSPALTIQFTDKSTGYMSDWSWNFGDGTSSVERNPKKTYAKKGTYTVKQYVQTITCDGKKVWVSYAAKVTVR